MSIDKFPGEDFSGPKFYTVYGYLNDQHDILKEENNKKMIELYEEYPGLKEYNRKIVKFIKKFFPFL